MKRSTAFLIATIASGAAFLASSVGAVWWWALFGMRQEVGNACTVTAFVLFWATLGLAMAADAAKTDEKWSKR